jgi:exodeoxyribonuclease VII large subunit
MPMVRVIIRPVRVQGAEAPPDIVAALHDVCGREDVDLIIVGRGGGSIEDLGAFNDERVARAIAAASVPVISAVGHETDITIADLVADRRAPTPTAAANLAVPDRRDLLRAIDDAAEALTAAVVRLVRQRRDALQATARRLRDPRRDLRTTSSRLQELRHRLARASAAQVLQTRQRLTALADRLQALNPLAVLDRGYSLTTHLVTRTIVRDAAALQPGDDLEIRLASGRAVVRVLTTHRS